MEESTRRKGRAKAPRMTKEQKGRGGLADPLCSRNARPQKALVGPAQLGISQTTPLRRIYENEPSVRIPSIRGALEEIRGGKRRRKNEMG